MKKFVIGLLVGSALTVGILKVPSVLADDGDPGSYSYKKYLSQMLFYMKQVNQSLIKIEENTRAVREKLKA